MFQSFDVQLNRDKHIFNDMSINNACEGKEDKLR